MLKRVFIAIGLLAVAAFGQGYMRHTLYFYDGSGNVEYVCSAASEQGVTTWSLAAKSLTNIVDAGDTATVTTVGAHGLTVGNTITIAGVVSDPALNGIYAILTTPTTNTFTVATAKVTDATYAAKDADMSVSYNGPRLTAAIWSIQRFYYDASNNLVKSGHAVGTPVTPGRIALERVCANRAGYEYR